MVAHFESLIGRIFVNASVLAGDGIAEALAQTVQAEDFLHRGDRALLILAEMTTKGSLTTGDYTKSYIEIARKHKDFVVGFVATQSLVSVETDSAAPKMKISWFLPLESVARLRVTSWDGSIKYLRQLLRGVQSSGRGIYAAEDPVASVKL